MATNVKSVTFDDVKPLWEKLWPGRGSEIRNMSSMTSDSSWDMAVYDNHTPHFFAILDSDNGTIIGVNSGHGTSDTHFRSRGLYVEPDHRGNGYGRQLVAATADKAAELGFDVCWTIPRENAFHSYDSAGFTLIRGFNDQPNAYIDSDTGQWITARHGYAEKDLT